VARVVLFGATGYTGRLTAEAMVAAGVEPVLAGRDRSRLEALAGRLGGLAVAEADTARPGSVRDLVGRGDVLVSTVGPFLTRGGPAVRAAVEAGATYLDATGEPPFLRQVFERHGPAAAGRCALVPAFGYDFVPGNLAGALALAEAGWPIDQAAEAGGPVDGGDHRFPPRATLPEGALTSGAGGRARPAGPDAGRATRVTVGYFVTGGGGFSSGTVASGAGMLLEPGFAWRDGRLRVERTARRLRAFPVAGRDWLGVSYGGSEHYSLPRLAPGLRDVEVYLGWFGRRSRAVQLAAAAGAPLARLPGVGALARAATGPLARRTGRGPDDDARRSAGSLFVAVAADADGRELAHVRLRGPGPYGLTAALLAWGARRAVDQGVRGTGALGPVEAFGLATLHAGAAEAGLERVDAEPGGPGR
jgi:short subunit dehydrogenase-like uncharacterized protein